MFWSKKRKKSMNHFFMNTTTLTKISKNIFITNHWIWHKFIKIWKFRKMNKCVDRIYFIDVKINELFYLRLLFVNLINCTSFEKLKTMFLQIENAKRNQIKIRLLNIYKNACRVFELIDNDDEWHVVMTKTIEFDTTIIFRNLIIIILLKCAFVESTKLWENHKIA